MDARPRKGPFRLFWDRAVSSAITAGNIAEQEYNNKLDMVREFLRAREVPLKQRRKVVAFYINYLERQTVRAWERGAAWPPGAAGCTPTARPRSGVTRFARQVFDERELLDMLPETIATPLMKEMYKSVVAPVPFLNRLPDESLSAVCLLVRSLPLSSPSLHRLAMRRTGHRRAGPYSGLHGRAGARLPSAARRCGR
jgi:hypothetical protein